MRYVRIMVKIDRPLKKGSHEKLLSSLHNTLNNSSVIDTGTYDMYMYTFIIYTHMVLIVSN